MRRENNSQEDLDAINIDTFGNVLCCQWCRVLLVTGKGEGAMMMKLHNFLSNKGLSEEVLPGAPS